MLAKLQEKNRMYKRLAENAEEMATANLARLRRAQVCAGSHCLYHSQRRWRLTAQQT